MTKENNMKITELDSEYKQKQLEELRKRVLEDTSLTARTDDIFLTRFLRAKAYHINSAYYMLKGYVNYNEKYTNSWLTIQRPLMKQVLGSEVIDIIPNCDSEGRRVFWFRFGKWNPRDFPPEAGLHVAALIAQLALLESIPLESIISVYDLKDTSFAHAKNVTPSFAKRMVAFLTNCAPVHILQIHIVRESTVFGMLFSIFKAFLDERIKKRISIHGNNFESLHKAIDKKILPPELGGEAEPLDPLRWNDELQKESVIKEIGKEGYVIVD
ncbi:alpha-tocopherol transfer protein-like [Chrysoperla carnea]|uniref:alpha-tocopherol transfer protein-like n=1 Tax=Chrysoperla carnea TaxID=189513 RepID=UPI001D0653C6|nr:alpha-tocopherol transfer protein-like [Chrysoperla carnea]